MVCDGCRQGAGTDSASELSESTSDRKPERKKRRKKTVERGPRLTVLEVNGSIVECQLETAKQKTVTFKFDLSESELAEVTSDVAHNLVRTLDH